MMEKEFWKQDVDHKGRTSETEFSEKDPRSVMLNPTESYREDYKQVMPHYYGDIVRKLFLTGSLVTMITVPLFAHMFTHPFYIPSGFAVLFGVLAALTSPAQKIVLWMDALVAGIMVVGFEYYASNPWMYGHMDVHNILLRGIYLFLGILFFFAFYYSIKTIRGYFLKK